MNVPDRRRFLAPVVFSAFVAGLALPQGAIVARAADEKTEPAVKAPKRLLVAREGDSFLEEIDGQRVLHLAGEPHAMGVAHGKLLAKEAREDVDAYLRDFAFGRMQYTMEYLQSIYQRAKPHIPPEYLDEMRGLAEGSGIPLQEIEAVHIIPELHHCSGAAVFGKMTKDGKLYHYRSLDYNLGLGSKKKVQDNACLIVRKPKKGYASVVVGWAGTLGCVTGMSDQGISIGEMGSSSFAETFDGTPMWFRLRWILENARTLDEGVRGFEEWKRTCGYNFIITDGKIPDARAIEVDKKRCAVFGPGGAEENVAPHEAIPFAVRRVNHFVDPELAARQRRPYDPREGGASGSYDGYKRISEYLRQNEGKIDGEAMISLCRGYPKKHSCLHQAVFCTTDLRFWVANAKDPTTTELAGAQNQTFFAYDMKDLLGTDPAKLALKSETKTSATDAQPEKKEEKKTTTPPPAPSAPEPMKTSPGETTKRAEESKKETKPGDEKPALEKTLQDLASSVKNLGSGAVPAPTGERLVKLLGGEPTGTASEPALEAKDEDEGTETALKLFERPAGKFSYRLEEKERKSSYVKHKLRFPSSAHTYDESDAVDGHYYEPVGHDGEKLPGCVVCHHLGGSFEAEETLARFLSQKGIASVMLALPNYGPRKAPGTKEGFLGSGNPLDALTGIRQAVLDVRRAADVLRAQPCVDARKVGVAGISLGAIVASDAAGIDTRFSRAVFVIGGGDFLKIIKNAPEAKGYTTAIEKLGLDGETLKKGFDLVDPDTFAHRLRADDVLMLNAEKDEIFPRESTLGLWRKAGYPKIKWFNTGHYGMALHFLEVMNDVLDHVKGSAPERSAD
ncbi:hypothetical protein HY251_08840 [bacterium]|nr:hypothetical protein [bacterium]